MLGMYVRYVCYVCMFYVCFKKVDPHSGLLKRTKMFSFFKIFRAPPKFLNLQQSKSCQNGLKISLN